jgi:hypothetical protein
MSAFFVRPLLCDATVPSPFYFCFSLECDFFFVLGVFLLEKNGVVPFLFETTPFSGRSKICEARFFGMNRKVAEFSGEF